jgi:hypothetical protein
MKFTSAQHSGNKEIRPTAYMTGALPSKVTRLATPKFLAKSPLF